MKKHILVFCLLVSATTMKSFGQFNAMAGIYSGYGQTAYNMKGYDNTGFMPLGIRAAIGMYSIQLGADFCTYAMSPSFDLKDSSGQDLYTDKIKSNYLGAMLRFHMGDDPRDFAFILRGGVGMWFSKKDLAYSNYSMQHFNLTDQVLKYDNSIGFNGAMGFSIPIKDEIHLTLEGQFNYNERKWENKTEFHTSWCVQLGVSYNFFNRYDLGRY